MKRLEAICDAVADYNNYRDPESDAYELRNPGMVLGESGKRRFSCHKAGYAALMDRVQKYCSAHPADSIESLLEFLGIKMKLQRQKALDFMGRCSNAEIRFSTNLKWFLEDQNGNASASHSG